MQTIRSFLYLDEYKMYSISSQIFRGLTEYLTDYQGTTREDSENQSGPFGSGRAMANILRSESMTQERKYLHDYAYSLFEKSLKDDTKVLNIAQPNIDRNIDRINDFGFVEVRAKAVFKDMNAIRSIITNFNDLGEALAYVSNLQDIEDAQQQIEMSIGTTRDRNSKARLRERQKALTDLKKNIAKAQGLYYDPVALEKLSRILEYGFQDRFEVQMAVEDYIFSAILKTECLREHEQLLVSKYSRFSEKEFVLFGTVAQGPTASLAGNGNETDDAGSDEDDIDGSVLHMKEAIMGLIDTLSQVDSHSQGNYQTKLSSTQLHCSLNSDPFLTVSSQFAVHRMPRFHAHFLSNA